MIQRQRHVCLLKSKMIRMLTPFKNKLCFWFQFPSKHPSIDSIYVYLRMFRTIRPTNCSRIPICYFNSFTKIFSRIVRLRNDSFFLCNLYKKLFLFLKQLHVANLTEMLVRQHCIFQKGSDLKMKW